MTDDDGTSSQGDANGEVRFTIVIPTRDRPAQLARCLAALARQSFAKDRFEVLVVDDGSEPPVADRADGVFERLCVRVLRQENAGPAAARNAGAAAATTARLVFTDDDCLPDPAWLETLAREWPKPGDVMVGGAIENALPANAYSTASQELISYIYEYFNTPEPRFFCSNNIALRRDSFLAVGGFDTTFPFAAGEDRDFCDRWVFSGRPTAYVAAAKVQHAHELDLRGFCRQHFRYGRAAARYHRLYAGRRGSPVRVEPLRFYTRLLLFPFGRIAWRRAPACSVLLALSQAINAWGFFYETFVQRRDRRAR